MNQFRNDAKGDILVVDDVLPNLKVLSVMLKKHGYDVRGAPNGETALMMASAEPPDLVLLDVRMPEMDGYEVCKKLKENEKTKDVPVIFISALDDTQDKLRGFDVGGLDYITKPFKMEEVKARVETHLTLRNLQKQLINQNSQLEAEIQERKNAEKELRETEKALRHSEEKLRRSNVDLEAKVEERTRELKAAHQRLASLEKAKSDFLRLISHEIRTPISAILNSTPIIERLSESEQQRKFIGYIEKAADRLLKFSKVALLITSLKSEHYKTNFSKIPAKHLIEYSLQMLQGEVEKAVNWITNIESDDINLYVDMDLMTHCVVAILENAVKYAPEDSDVEIKVYTTETNKIILEVLDNGNGFSENALEKLFDYFPSEDVLHHHEGFGLGLAAAKLIMDVHSGEIQASNRADTSGASVRLIFKDYRKIGL